MYNLAQSYLGLEMYDKAVRLGMRTLAFMKRVWPENPTRICNAMNIVASAYQHLGRHEEALILLDQVMAIHKRILPMGDPKIDEIATLIEEVQSLLL